VFFAGFEGDAGRFLDAAMTANDAAKAKIDTKAIGAARSLVGADLLPMELILTASCRIVQALPRSCAHEPPAISACARFRNVEACNAEPSVDRRIEA